MHSPPHFLHLPREVRSIIYGHYVYEDSGYHYDCKSSKLRASNNRPINLNLMYTCKAIATEMRGVALGTNTITFTTIHDQQRAGDFSTLMYDHFLKKCYLLDLADRQLNSGLINRIAEKFPVYLPVLEQLRAAAESEDLTDSESINSTSTESSSSQNPESDDPLESEEAGVIDAETSEATNVGLGDNTDAASIASSDTASRFRLCAPPFAHWTTSYGWHEAHSIHQAFVDYAIECISAQFDFNELNKRVEAYSDRVETYDVPRILFSWHWKPWSIPSDHEIDEMCEILRLPRDRELFEKQFKSYFSAASVAIRFLATLALETRLQIRNIILSEARRSEQNPECHALGLIPFCVENKLLRIERRVNLWRNVLSAKGYELGMLADIKNGRSRSEHLATLYDEIRAWKITERFRPWILEALELRPAGMPAKSFSLVFDGDPLPDTSSQVLERLKRDAAWQDALEQCFTQRNASASFDWLRRAGPTGPYQIERFSQCVKNIFEADSLVHFNFPVQISEIAHQLDTQQVLEENRSCNDYFEWHLKWRKECEEHNLRTSPPLPSWLDIQLEQILPADPV